MTFFTTPKDLAKKFLFRVQIGLAYPPSSYGPLSGPTDLARNTSIVAVKKVDQKFHDDKEACIFCIAHAQPPQRFTTSL